MCKHARRSLLLFVGLAIGIFTYRKWSNSDAKYGSGSLEVAADNNASDTRQYVDATQQRNDLSKSLNQLQVGLYLSRKNERIGLYYVKGLLSEITQNTRKSFAVA